MIPIEAAWVIFNSKSCYYSTYLSIEKIMRLFSVYRGLYCILPSNIGFTRIRFSTKQYFMESIRVFLMFFFFFRGSPISAIFHLTKTPLRTGMVKSYNRRGFGFIMCQAENPGKSRVFSVFGARSSHGDICHQKWSSHFASVQRTLIKGLSSRQLTFFLCVFCGCGRWYECYESGFISRVIQKTSWHLIVFFGFCFLAEFWCVAAMAGQAIEQDIYFSRESGGRCSWALGGKAKTPFRHPISTGHSLEAFQKMPVNFRFFMFVCHMGMYWIRENTQIFGFQFTDSASIPAGKKKHWGGNFHRDPQLSMCPCESKLPDSPNKLHVFQETCRFSWQNSDFYTSNSIHDSRILSREFQLLNLHDSHHDCILGWVW